jgi:hypothetical protein
VLVLPEIALKKLMTDVVQATHGITDTAGEPQAMSTIPEAQMRMAALVAVQIATGQTVWPGDKRIVITRPKQAASIFTEA